MWSRDRRFGLLVGQSVGRIGAYTRMCSSSSTTTIRILRARRVDRKEYTCRTLQAMRNRTRNLCRTWFGSAPKRGVCCFYFLVRCRLTDRNRLAQRNGFGDHDVRSPMLRIMCVLFVCSVFLWVRRVRSFLY